MTGRVAELSAVSAIALVITLVIAAPVVRAPAERIFGMETMGRHHDPFTVMEQFGRPIALGARLQPLTDIPGSLLAQLTGPVAAYNWLVLLTFPMSAAAAYLLARYLSLTPVGAAIAAMAFAFSPFHLAHAAYHPHIAQTQWVPLYLLALWHCLDESTPSAVAFLTLAVVGVTLSNFYGGLIAAASTPVAIATYWWFKCRKQPRSLRHLAITSVTLLCIGACGIVYASYAAHGTVVTITPFVFERQDLFRFSAKWWSYLVPPIEHPLLGGLAQRVWSGAGVQAGLLEQQVTLGWGMVAAGLVAVFAWMKGDRQPIAMAAVPVLSAVALAALVCSLSPERTIGHVTFTRPSAVLYAIVPMFRSYARFGVVVQLMAVLLAGIGVERLWRSGTRRGQIASVACLVCAAGEYAVWPPSLWRDVLPTTAHRWVVRQQGLVHALDCASLTPESESIQWLSGNRISLGTGAFDDCTEPRLADKLSAAGYTHLLVRRDTPVQRWFRSQGPPEGLQEAARLSDGDVFVVTAQPPLVYTARMATFYSREYDGGWTWRWMGPDASLRVVNTSHRPIVAALDVEMTAFHRARRLTLVLDGSEVRTLLVEPRRGLNRIGPLTLTPGEHDLVFHPCEAPTVANDA
ncbi:MAG TPA: 6-pyruvoyl-tetrahydropterin synthase-related protein, partial [Vicinamibacterales bacterium]|nr:6-pyruvoyl-tetrahydropterin synthase-related protein [Vicinamibacterales bacterium]